jgi:hypothetical protein
VIYGLLILMTVLIGAYVLAWFVSPSLRKCLERPNQNLLDNSEKFEQVHKNSSGVLK